MSDPLNHESMSDDLFRNRIAAALRELDQPESDADIAAALDAIATEPLGEPSIQRMLAQVRTSIAIPADRAGIARSIQPLPTNLANHTETKPQLRAIPPRNVHSHGPIVVACLALTLLLGTLAFQFRGLRQEPIAVRNRLLPDPRPGELIASRSGSHPLAAIATQETSSIDRVKTGDTLSTGPRQKRRVTLPDGSVLSINERSQVTILSERRVKVLAGEVFVEVASTRASTADGIPAVSERFVVETPTRSITALGTKFVVKAEETGTNVVVTQGKVRVSGVDDVIPAGFEMVADRREAKSIEVRPAKRSAYVVDWVKDLMAAAGSIVIPTSEHAGGTITVVDPQGQEMKLSLRKFHVDVYIEDGFARTTIDQTYFNHTWQQLEGTFRFPLPADASLSRLAMYVNGTLMEGGMVERDYGRNVFEQIRHTRRDPALLEWVDGSTFQMRVFPLEARQEKRILLSYTQRLPGDYGHSVYRFPAGHNLDGVREWTTQLRVKGASGTKWYSPSHLLSARGDQGDLLIEGPEDYAENDRELVVEMCHRAHPPPMKTDPTWSMCEQDGYQYVMLRQRPELKADAERLPRHWIFLVENSADRNDVLAATQRQIVKTLLENVEHTDTFSMIRAGTQSESFRRKPVVCSLDNVAAAQKFLQEVAPIGALDLEQALQAVQSQQTAQRDVWIVHLGTGIPVLGERDETTLRRLLPAKARYVGVAVGKRWSKSFMQTAANRSGGHVTQINPDEAVAWRAFDLLSTLNAPRLTEISINASDSEDGASQDPAKSRNRGIEFLLLTNHLAHGQELAAVARIPAGQSLPKSVTITGQLNGKAYSSEVAVRLSAIAPTSKPYDDATVRTQVDSEQNRNQMKKRDQSAGPHSDQVAPASQLLNRGNSISSGGAQHLPRTWARLEIDRLVSQGAGEHKAQIIELSKSMYVMSPFTSLLVLETEAMYAQFNVDRGRKDHWAMYPAPATIPVVVDNGPSQSSPLDAAKDRLQLARSRAESAKSNYERSIAENRPATDVQRLQRLSRTEQVEVQMIEREIQRIEQANTAAADPVRQAWLSVIGRRSGWRYSQPQDNGAFPQNWSGLGLSNQYHYWGETEESHFVRLRRNLPDNWSKLHRWDVEFDSSNGIPIDEFTLNQIVESSASTPERFNLPMLYKQQIRAKQWPDSSSGRADIALRFSVQPNSGMPPVSPWFTELVEDAYIREERYDKVPILDPGVIRVLNPTMNSFYTNERFIECMAIEEEHLQKIEDQTLPGAYYLSDDIQFASELKWRHLSRAHGTIARYKFRSGPVDDFSRIRSLSYDVSGFRRREDMANTEGFDVISNDVSEVLREQEIPVVRYGASGLNLPFGNSYAFGTNGRLIGSLITADGESQFDIELPKIVAGDSGFHSHLWGSRYILLPNSYDRHQTEYEVIHSPHGLIRIASHPLTGVVGDLPSYAPGLQTWHADRLAVVEKARTNKPQNGSVDADARRLIEKARSLGWERVSRANQGQGPRAGRASDVVIVDGAGRFLLEHEVGEGLHETVIQNGTLLWHLYPEIGLGSKRTFSRFHQSAIQSLVPWYVPSVDDLSVGADIKTIGERTVRITNVPPAIPEAKDGVDGKKANKEQHQIGYDLVFAEDGRLCESRVTDMTANKLLAKQTIDATGMIRVFDGSEKLVAEAKYERIPVEAPDLTAPTKELIVLPLPYRSSASAPVNVPVNLQTNAPDYAKLSDDDAMTLLATYFAEARAPELASFVERRFSDRGDHRIGLAVLLASVVTQNQIALPSVTSQHPNLPLASFLDQWAKLIPKGDLTGQIYVVEAAPLFLKRVSGAYYHYSRWASDRASNRARPVADIERELAETLVFVRECRSLNLAAKLLATIHASLKRTERMNAGLARQLNQTTLAIAEERGLVSFGRVPRIEWLLTIGDETSVTQATDLMRTHLADSIATTGLLDLDVETRAAFVKHFGTPNGQPCHEWGALVRQATFKMLEEKQYFTLIEVARRSLSLGEPVLAAEIFAFANKDLDLGARPLLNLMALEYAKEAENWELAEACLKRALANEKLQKISQLWKDASEVAHHRKNFAVWIEYLDRASELEFAELPKTVDLNAFRQAYEKLFEQFDQRTEQLVAANKVDQLAFAQLVQRAASRWREIDVDDTPPCHRTARILTKLGLAAAAWNYWTTPLAETPDQSTVWQTFASVMSAEHRFVIADQAWSTAFACEPTNPEILLNHAQFLRTTNQFHRADELLTRITTSTWQPRFDTVKNQAQTLLQGAAPLR